FAFPISEVATGDVRALMTYGRALTRKHEVAKHVCLFGYQLEAVDNSHARVFYLRPRSLTFDYSLTLGFIRAQIAWSGGPSRVGREGSIPRFSLQAAAEVFARKFHKVLCELKDMGTPLQRVRLHIPKDPDSYRVVTGSFL